MHTPKPVYMTIPDAAEHFGIGRHTLAQAIRNGQLRAFRKGERGWSRVKTTEVEQWVESLAVSSPS